MKTELKCINTKKKKINSKKSGSKICPKKKIPKIVKKPFVKLTTDQLITNMKNNIIKNTNKLWVPKLKNKMISENTNSWFDHTKYTDCDTTFIGRFKGEPKPKRFKKCLTVRLFLRKTQRIIINNWLNACTVIYNETVKLLKTKKYDKFTSTKLFHTIRAILSAPENSVKDKVQEKSLKKLNKIPNINEQFTNTHAVKKHILDYSIKEACKNYCSGRTQIKTKHIKQFELKELKFDRPNRVLTIEKTEFSKNAFFENVFGKIKGKYNGKRFKFDKVNSDSILKFNSKTNSYYLYVPCDVNVKSERKKIKKYRENEDNETEIKKMISLDPGLRTFMTGITENSVEKICSNYTSMMKPLLKKETNLSHKPTSSKIRKKLNIVRRKIKNKIDDMQWKTINYLTKNHENIYIGDLSTKNVVKNGKSNLSGYLKKLLLRTNLYSFRERLKYKCAIRGVNCQVVNEYYTSKMCSCCGEINENLSSKKVFKCAECKVVLDRDVNGARNIYLKRYIK